VYYDTVDGDDMDDCYAEDCDTNDYDIGYCYINGDDVVDVDVVCDYDDGDGDDVCDVDGVDGVYCVGAVDVWCC